MSCISINGSYLNHLRYADDIVVLAESAKDFQKMLEELNHASLKIGLKMNMEKTKVMATTDLSQNPISIQGIPLEQVKEYVYLGQVIKLGRDSLKSEIERRIQLGWAAYGKLKGVFKSKMGYLQWVI